MAIKHLLLKIYGLSDIIIKEIKIHRDVAQLGSAIASGVIGRRFKSCHPDQALIKNETKE